jgi:negative regulator of flagellin synthesis FlgM
MGGGRMKISDIELSRTLQSIQQAAQSKSTSQREVEAETKASSQQVDRVDLSIRSKELKRIEEVVASAPDVRAERVEALKKLIEDGKYEVDSKALAQKMIEEALFEINR